MHISLNGAWQFKETGEDGYKEAKVPGCNYLDLFNNDIIPDPFLSEQEVQWVGERDWEYVRDFELKEEEYGCDVVELIMESLDTLANVFVNDSLALSASNAHIRHSIDLKPYVKPGINTLKIIFLSPNKYIAEGQKLNKYPTNRMGLDGVQHIRKNQSHFGWDWGPILPLSGITRSIYINCVNLIKLNDVYVTQEHYQNRVKLNIKLNVKLLNKEGTILSHINLTAPDGRVETFFNDITTEETTLNIDIENPEYWEANGMSERQKQPLYQLEVNLKHNDKVHDSKKLNIGIRTISLNTSFDKWGRAFQFIINGTPIFAKGANWIPMDSLVNYDAVRMDSLVRSAKAANMNMLRVWGGGYYECNEFYDACDRYGILVWQDFGFSCMPYHYDALNLHGEIIDNVTRLRNHACLALWCGNNEIELLSTLWILRREFIKETEEFFYNTLPTWLKEYDDITPYWPGSPSSGEYMKNLNKDSSGDTHLWQVWHGLKPYNYYRNRLTRFCSEFGLESFPDIETIRKFNENLDPKIMDAHQKCIGGNIKILYYLLDRFRLPERYEDIVYLSQLSQMESVSDAVEHWRRNSYRCSGAMYWQFNDCWPVISWSSVDYYGRWKALHYAARRFNAPILLSIENSKSELKLTLVNDLSEYFEGEVVWEIMTYDGKVLAGASIEVKTAPLNSEVVETIIIDDHISKEMRLNTFFTAEIKGLNISRRFVPFVLEKDMALSKPHYEIDVKNEKNKAIIDIKADTYSRFVCLKVKDNDRPLSDNYFDLLPNVIKSIDVETESELTLSDITVFSIADIKPKHSKLRDRALRLKIKLKPINILYAIGQLFT